MTQFQYTALTVDGKEVRGSVDAPTLDAARDSLLASSLEVVTLEESKMSRAGTFSPFSSEALQTYIFEGRDTSGVVRHGSVQALSKFDAFQKLRKSPGLLLTILTEEGRNPPDVDRELQTWQNSVPPPRKPFNPPQAQVILPSSPQVQVSKEQEQKAPFAENKTEKKSSLSFTESVRTDVPMQQTASSQPTEHVTVHLPIVSTLRLYAGWLLAWYGLFMILGYYVSVRTLSIDIPFVQAFYSSRLILSFSIALFLFLLLSDLHRRRGGKAFGFVLFVIGIALFVALRTFIE